MFSEFYHSPVFMNFITCLISLFAVLFGFGLLKYLYIKLSYSSKLIRFFGVVGVPVHELSHLIMCVVFGHKVDDFKLYTIEHQGTLGYVSHRYNPRNTWHQIGRFFIGIAPLLMGILLIVVLSKYLLIRGDELVHQIQLYSAPPSISQAHKIELFGIFRYVYLLCSDILIWEIKNNFGYFMMYSALTASVGLFLCPSKKDLQNALISGIVIIFLSFLAASVLGKLDNYLIFLSSSLIIASSVLFSSLFVTFGLTLIMLVVRVCLRTSYS